jgi:ubiquinone/menaquinone biosynthesis C-methylase UbiE
MSQKFNQDTQALKAREQVNAAGAVHNLEDWIIDQVRPRPGMRVLDLGCGTGKQIFALADLVTSQGVLVGVDISKQAVETVNERARHESISQVSAVQSSLDDVLERLKSEQFDLIISSYAFYYASDMKRLFTGLRSILKPQGQIFVCGPGIGTNQEMIDLMNRLLPLDSSKVPSIDDFIQAADLAAIKPYFEKLRTVRLQNHIRFSSPDSVLQWWRNHNSYLREIDGEMAQAIGAHFDKHNDYLLSKNVFGVHAHV